jgi:predicted methyltransferase
LADARVIVREVAAAVGLSEGERGVRAVLAAVARLEPVSTRRLARTVDLPVPIVASVCGELRKRGVVAEERPTRLTPLGRELFAAGGLDLHRAATCPRCAGRGLVVRAELKPLLAEMKQIAWTAPPARPELDQCHCTPETKLRRVLALHEADALVGRRVLFLGDDDLTSLAVERVVRRLDLRDPLPPSLRGAFDTVVTDPPYTVAGARLFLARAAEALDATGGDVLFSFGSRRPGVALLVQRAIAELGFTIVRVQRDFNEYVGAGVLGGTSSLYHLSAASEPRPVVADRYDGPLYTADAPALTAV